MATSKSRGFGKGRSPTRFSYTYEDLSILIGCSVEAARKRAQRGDFDPANINSILEFVKNKLNTPVKNAAVEDSNQLIEQIEALKKSR